MKKQNKMKILVTGGAGFVGSNIAMELQTQGHEVVVMDDFSSGNFNNLIGFKGDVISEDMYEFMPADQYFDAIFHQAAITDTTIMDQKLMMEVNVEAFKNLLYFARENNIPKVIYASSAGTYGNGKCPMKESAKTKPENVYGFSKLIMDNVAMKFAKHNKDITIVGLRYFNVYGPGEYYKGKTASMMFQLYNQMVAGKRPKIFKHGEQERDFVYIKDVVKANMCAFKNAKKSCVVNVATGKPRDFNDVVKCLNKGLKTDYKAQYINNPYPFYQLKTQADMTKAKELIKYTAGYSLEKGIADYVKILEQRK